MSTSLRSALSQVVFYIIGVLVVGANLSFL